MDINKVKVENETADSEAIDLEELENVSGGYEMRDPGIWWEMRFTFTSEEAKKLKEQGFSIEANKEYCRSDLNRILGLDASTAREMQYYLAYMGL
ncbi:MAG: hypothetical protein IKS49_08140 [Actinomycetaceae bacterium]|nr:hypothetical protein [Ruminococcus sp.]MBR6460098.1 hypothetical protein [Actinomycetaceae bacterium]